MKFKIIFPVFAQMVFLIVILFDIPEGKHGKYVIRALTKLLQKIWWIKFVKLPKK